MNLADIKSVYFVGAGGIGMSALVRRFLSMRQIRQPDTSHSSELTEQLPSRRSHTYEENVDLIHPCASTKRLLRLFSNSAVPKSIRLSCVISTTVKAFRSGCEEGPPMRVSKGLCVKGVHKTPDLNHDSPLLHQSYVDAPLFWDGIKNPWHQSFVVKKIVLTG